MLYYGFHDALQILNSHNFPLNYDFIVLFIVCGHLFIYGIGRGWDFLLLPEYRMIFELLESDSGLRVQGKNLIKKVTPDNLLFFWLKTNRWFVFLHVLNKVETLCAFYLNIVQNIDSLEGKIPTKKIVKKHPQRPDIRLLIILHWRQYLRSHVSLSSTVGNGSVTLQLSGKPKIPNFAYVIAAFCILFKKNIFHLQIPMNNVVLMNELDTPEDLIEDVYALLPSKNLVGEFALKIVQATHVTVFHYQEIPIVLYKF